MTGTALPPNRQQPIWPPSAPGTAFWTVHHHLILWLALFGGAAVSDLSNGADTEPAADARGGTGSITASKVPDSDGEINEVSSSARPNGFDSPQTLLLDAALLKSVRHRTLGIRPEEADAYYHVLRLATQVNGEKLRQAARQFRDTRRREDTWLQRYSDDDFPTFVDVFQHPDLYSGRPITLQGHVRRLMMTDAGENTYGISTLYEAWLYTQDSQRNPTVVVCTSVPTGMPLGGDILEQVSVTGYFFKMYGYQAQDGMRVAPLILAHRLEWHRLPEAAGHRLQQILVLVGITLVVAIAVCVLWRLSRADRRHRTRLLKAESNSTTFAADVSPPLAQGDAPDDRISHGDLTGDANHPGSDPAGSAPEEEPPA